MAKIIIKVLMISILVPLLSSLCGCYIHTKHEIEAHITIDIRQIKEAAVNIEEMVSGQTETKNKKLNKNFLFLIGEAYAEEPQLNYMTPEIESAVESRKARHSEIEVLKYEGAIGENNRGLLEIIGESSLKSSKEVEEIVQEENEDRETIYWSIIQQNNLPENAIDSIREVFASTHRERAVEGERVQLLNGRWIRK